MTKLNVFLECFRNGKWDKETEACRCAGDCFGPRCQNDLKGIYFHILNSDDQSTLNDKIGEELIIIFHTLQSMNDMKHTTKAHALMILKLNDYD